MYQPYPSGAQMPEAQRPPAPRSVLNAVKLMYVGAVVSAVGLGVSLATSGGLKKQIKHARPNLTKTQVNSLDTALIALAVIFGVFAIGLWLWMAWKNKAGKNWARVTGTVFFGIDTVGLISVFTQPGSIAGKLLSVLVWLVGLGAIVLLWRGESSSYFRGEASPAR
jgi:hypothetical protein